MWSARRGYLGRLKGAPGEGARLPSKPKLRALVLGNSVGEARATVPVPGESDACCRECRSWALSLPALGRTTGVSQNRTGFWRPGLVCAQDSCAELSYTWNFFSWSIDLCTKDANLSGRRLQTAFPGTVRRRTRVPSAPLSADAQHLVYPDGTEAISPPPRIPATVRKEVKDSGHSKKKRS